MKSRWYLSTFVILLALLGGVVGHQHQSVPNQEIILQFIDSDVTTDEAQNTIAVVKRQLLNIGIDYILVKEQRDGKLKITYFSNIAVENIKAVLSVQNNIDFGCTTTNSKENPIESSPIDDHSIGYNLDVFEISSGNDALTGLTGKLALEQKPDNIRFYNPNFYTPFNDIQVKDSNRIVKIAFDFRTNCAITIDNSSKKIPEVRAGPLS